MPSSSHLTTVGGKQEVTEVSKGLDLVFPSSEMGTPVEGAGGRLGVGGRHLTWTDGVGEAQGPGGVCPASGLNRSSKLQIGWDHLQAEKEDEGSRGEQRRLSLDRRGRSHSFGGKVGQVQAHGDRP